MVRNAWWGSLNRRQPSGSVQYEVKAQAGRTASAQLVLVKWVHGQDREEVFGEDFFPVGPISAS